MFLLLFRSIYYGNGRQKFVNLSRKLKLSLVFIKDVM